MLFKAAARRWRTSASTKDQAKARCSSLRLRRPPPADNGAQHPDVVQRRLIGWIRRQRNEIREIARLQRPEIVLPERGVSGPVGVRPQRLLRRQTFVRAEQFT